MRHCDTFPGLSRIRHLTGLNCVDGTGYIVGGPNSLLEAAMDRFLNQQNIERYRKLREARNASERLQVMKLLAEEKAKFKLEHLTRASSKIECCPS
jgi:hypothetical protein